MDGLLFSISGGLGFSSFILFSYPHYTMRCIYFI